MMRSVNLIPATESDLDRIDLMRSYIDDLIKTDLYDLRSATIKAKTETEQLLKSTSEVEQSLCLMCFEDETEIGHVWLNLTDTELFIINLEVYEEYRGQGFGKSIVQAVEQLAVEKDLNRISLSVFPRNKRAMTLYKNSGYSELTVRMEKRL
ncbi:MAG: GNAT family N-acetyltransferase [Chitinophagaceae bacterium]|nr:GNAT family N-acetyltransferase [Oligoflexus sp.]